MSDQPSQTDQPDQPDKSAPESARFNWRRTLDKVVRGGSSSELEEAVRPGLSRSPQTTNQATHQTTTNRTGTVVSQPSARHSTAATRRSLSRLLPRRPPPPSQDSDGAEPLLGGYEGFDYEVVRESRGPGTKGAMLVLILMLGVAAIVGIRTVDWLRQKLDPRGDPTGEVIVTLPPGSSSSSISELLAGSDVIPDATAYEWYVRLRGGPTFQAGDYVFQQNSSVWEALEVLEGGPTQVEQAAQLSLTIPEGLTISQIAEVIDTEAGLRFSGDDFLDVLNLSPVLSQVAPSPDGLATVALNQSEGLLFGDTYFLTPTATASDLISVMTAQMDVVLEELGYGDAFARVGLTPYEALIVASIVEGEASRSEDRPKLAQVVYNRLANGMTLGMDATVRYLVDGGDVNAAALAIDSPYNTRLNPGLPPTPINAPSREALLAALNPEPGDWLFVVKTEADGTLSFSVEYDQFLIDRERCIELGFCG